MLQEDVDAAAFVLQRVLCLQLHAHWTNLSACQCTARAALLASVP